MLTAEEFDALLIPITDLYEQYTQSVINDIARRLKNLDFASAAWQVQRLTESGLVYRDVLKRLAQLTGKSEKELRALFKAAGVKTLKFDDDIYKVAGLNPVPLNLSPAMLRVLQAGLQKTGGVLNNLTMTTAINARANFIKAADLAYMHVSTGAMSYDQAIRAAVKQLADDGLSTINYASGHKDQLDVAMRRTVLTGVGQTAGQLQIARADEMGQDLVAVSAHVGARNTGVGPANHESWQGGIYSRTGNDTEYPPFIERTGYGTGPGLAGWNCRHSFYPFFKGISENAYFKKELESFAGKTVKYNGREIPIYQATQMQRAIERKIRKYKRQAGALEAAGLDNSSELARVKNYQSVMRDFTKQTGLQRQSVREAVVMIGKVNTPKVNPLQINPVIPVEAASIISKSKGKPVSEALDISGLKNPNSKSQVNLALSAIDSVHGDGALKRIPVIGSTSKRNYGMFRAFYGAGGAYNISIAASGNHKALTMIHEIGHFIDHGGFGKLWGASSGYDGFGKDLMKSVKNSEWFAGLYKRVDDFVKNAADGVFRLDRKYINYLASSRELFARAYAQFIATESGDPILLAQLKKLQDQEFPTQWSDRDFEPIAEEFRKLFKEKGWMQ